LICCCSSSVSAVTERLASSSHLFLCASPCYEPFLFFVGVASAFLQSVLLLLVWARAEANMFYELYTHGLVQANTTFSSLRNPGLAFPTGQIWSQLGRTDHDLAGVEAEAVAAATDPDARLDRYRVMIEWSLHHEWLPVFLTHPDLQLDYALIFSLAMLVIWVAKDLGDSLWCLSAGYMFAGAFLAMNVLLALLTGWDQMYVKFLPIVVWDTPANVIGVNPISMVLDSVAVMLILDLDEKSYALTNSCFSVAVGRLQRRLQDKEDRYAPLADVRTLAQSV